MGRLWGGILFVALLISLLLLDAPCASGLERRRAPPSKKPPSGSALLDHDDLSTQMKQNSIPIADINAHTMWKHTNEPSEIGLAMPTIGSQAMGSPGITSLTGHS